MTSAPDRPQYRKKTAGDRKAALKKIRALGQRMFKQGTITRHESLSALYYANAVDSTVKNGLKGSRGAEKLARWTKKVAAYIGILSAG